MTEITEPILDEKKLLEKITKLEELSQEIISIQNEQKHNLYSPKINIISK